MSGLFQLHQDQDPEFVSSHVFFAAASTRGRMFGAFGTASHSGTESRSAALQRSCASWANVATLAHLHGNPLPQCLELAKARPGTQMAVSVAEEVYFEISILGPKKLSDFQV